MSTIDLSREATDFRKHYAGVRMQQGKVLTDDDFNEAARLDSEDMRRTRLDTIGPYGSPDDGFLPTNIVNENRRLNFTLSAGSLYLGGLRLELNEDEAFALQKDWLNFNAEIDQPIAPANGQSRIDLVWIEAWEQSVCAVEDRELFEVALGGPDTTTRMRTMRRVHVLTGLTSDVCEKAWKQARDQWACPQASDLEMRSGARLKVSFTTPSTDATLCSPGVTGDFLGAENQAIRVQTLDADHFTWGYDNAAPLYRALLKSVGGSKTKLTLLTPPKDAAHWPIKGQVVEILPWSAALPNGERVAELAGHLTKVDSSYDPDYQEITLETAPPASFNEAWTHRSDKGSFYSPKIIGTDDVENYVYVRIWNRGDDLSSPAAVPLNSGTLGHTGLAVHFLGNAPRPGDHWIIAARPAAPDVVTPWSLKGASGDEPRGYRTYRAPLALLKWSGDGSAVVYDCRPKFKPLARLRCCIELVAKPGPGWHSIFAQVPSKGDAVICFPPGHYPVNSTVTVTGKGRLRLQGAGPATRIAGAGTNTVLAFQDCDGVDLRDMYCFGGNGHTTGLSGTISFQNVDQVDLCHVNVRCKPSLIRERACVHIWHDEKARAGQTTITHCNFYVGHMQVGLLALNLHRITVRDNHFLASGPDVGDVQRSLRDASYRTQLALASLVGPFPIKNSSIPTSRRFSVMLANKQEFVFATDEALLPFWKDLLKRDENVVKKLSTYAENEKESTSRRARVLLVHRLSNALESRRKCADKVLAPWIEALQNGQKAIIGQAVVIGGRKAEQVIVESNEIDGAAQGVHVGLSHHAPLRTEDTADKAVRVTIRQNQVRTLINASAPRDRHGIFVGNVRSAVISENYLKLERQPGARHLPVEGIRVFGFLGPVVQIQGNHLLDYSKGVNITVRGTETESPFRFERDNCCE